MKNPGKWISKPDFVINFEGDLLGAIMIVHSDSLDLLAPGDIDSGPCLHDLVPPSEGVQQGVGVGGGGQDPEPVCDHHPLHSTDLISGFSKPLINVHDGGDVKVGQLSLEVC